MAEKRMTEDEAVATLSDGMTIGIGGWGSRRKPMSLVRALLRTDLKDLTIVSYGGPDVGLLCAAGKVKRLVYGFVSLDSIALEPHFRAARQNGTIPEVGINGVTNETVLAALIHRTKVLNAKFPCRQNSIAITKMEEALMWFENRTAERQKRGVEGQHAA